MAKKRLGKGMDALFSEEQEERSESGESAAVSVKTSEIEPNRNQPRRSFDEDAIINLADSIRQHGILQPILVRPLDSGGYQIVAGERRWRAAKMVGLSEVPVFIKELDDFQAMQIALIENLQREDLNPIEEAEGYERLMKKYDMTQEQISSSVGKSRPAVANALRLLTLDDETKEFLQDSSITAGHARALLTVSDLSLRRELLHRIVKEGLSVRQTERLAADSKNVGEQTSIKFKDIYAKEIEVSLAEVFGKKNVTVTPSSKGSYQVRFKVSDKDALKQLATLCAEFELEIDKGKESK
ncbi:MAG: ParB/RepB/Spo0J family partition protein [Ruminococcus sp.]|nr:ParB/RepB/Spo0J family partition protein [Ruminococcus sp.]